MEIRALNNSKSVRHRSKNAKRSRITIYPFNIARVRTLSNEREGRCFHVRATAFKVERAIRDVTFGLNLYLTAWRVGAL